MCVPTVLLFLGSVVLIFQGLQKLLVHTSAEAQQAQHSILLIPNPGRRHGAHLQVASVVLRLSDLRTRYLTTSSPLSTVGSNTSLGGHREEVRAGQSDVEPPPLPPAVEASAIPTPYQSSPPMSAESLLGCCLLPSIHSPDTCPHSDSWYSLLLCQPPHGLPTSSLSIPVQVSLPTRVVPTYP